jgi:hypothetical protein
MLPWRFFRPYLGIFASIDADGAAFAAEMRRNSDSRSLGRLSESRAARLAVAQTELEAAEMEWLELELLREDLTSGSWLQEPATTLLYDFIRLLGLDIATSQSTFRMRIGRHL